MKFYLAPMEGITGYIFRNALSQFFKEGIGKFYTPFLVPCEKRALSAKERGEVLPSNNVGVNVIPQILTTDAGDFTRLKNELRELGYTEVNLNLGCPSRTVASKGRGAGALADTDALDKLLEGIFAEDDREISVKTRIGISDAEEFAKIFDVFRKYPIKELIIHPRTLKEQYDGNPHREIYFEAAKSLYDGAGMGIGSSRGINLQGINSLCFNGNIYSVSDYESLVAGYEEKIGGLCDFSEGLNAVMIGRGILRNPGLVREIVTGRQTSNDEIREFLDKLCVDYSRAFSGERPVLFKMKEIWSYLQTRFPGREKEMKKLIKSRTLAEYDVIKNLILSERSV